MKASTELSWLHATEMGFSSDCHGVSCLYEAAVGLVWSAMGCRVSAMASHNKFVITPRHFHGTDCHEGSAVDTLIDLP